jgi:hypothetical protein
LPGSPLGPSAPGAPAGPGTGTGTTAGGGEGAGAGAGGGDWIVVSFFSHALNPSATTIAAAAIEYFMTVPMRWANENCARFCEQRSRFYQFLATLISAKTGSGIMPSV